jgi:hypothetical protein
MQIRIVSVGADEVLVRVTRELGARGDGFLVYDRTRKVCIVSQSIAKTAALIRRLVDARLLDDWMALHPQGLYNVLGDKIAARAHKGWMAERVALCDIAERLSQVRSHGFAQVAIATTHPINWEVVHAK